MGSVAVAVGMTSDVGVGEISRSGTSESESIETATTWVGGEFGGIQYPPPVAQAVVRPDNRPI